MRNLRNLKILKALGLAVVLILVALGWSRISFNVDILKLLPGHLKQVQGLSLFLKHFSQPDELIITMEAEDFDQAASAALALAKELQAHPNLVTQAVAVPPWEKDPAGLADLVAYLLINQPPADITSLRESLSPEQAPKILAQTLDVLGESFSPQEIAMASYDPYGFSRFLLASGMVPKGMQSEFSSADGKFRVLYVTAAPSLANYKDAMAWIAEVRAVVENWKGDQKIQLGFTGEPAFVADISATMEWDMMSSSLVTLFVIGLIFLIAYHRLKPLFQLIFMLGIVFFITLGLAGFFLRELTVIGVGFASIMIGLSVDYGYLIYHRSLDHQGTLRDLQVSTWNNIKWTAGTTSAAFFALNLSSLPGLSQLGNLVGIGVLVGAAVMIVLFAPLAYAGRAQATKPTGLQHRIESPGFRRLGTILTFLLMLGLGSVTIFFGFPEVDSSVSSLRPRHSEAHTAMDHLYTRLSDDRALLSLVVAGESEAEVRSRLEKIEPLLSAAKDRGEVEEFHTPLMLWPAPERQTENLAALAELAQDGPRLQETLEKAGFTEEAYALTGKVLDQWKSWMGKPTPLWPEGESARWILRRVASQGDDGFLAMGLVRPRAGGDAGLTEAISSEGVYLVSWEALGLELNRVVPREFVILIGGLLGIVTILLVIGFRSIRDVGVLLLTLTLVFLALTGAMRLLGMSWNLFNLAAILLLLGTGIDYGILLLLALRRNGGKVAAAQNTFGLIIGLCAISAITGFASIGWANHQGLASLGLTCALGLALDALISFFILPVIWQISHGRWPRFGT